MATIGSETQGPRLEGGDRILGSTEHFQVPLLVLGMHFCDSDKFLDGGVSACEGLELGEVCHTYVVYSGQVTSHIDPRQLVVRLRTFRHVGQLVQVHHHPLFVLQNKWVHHLEKKLRPSIKLVREDERKYRRQKKMVVAKLKF